MLESLKADNIADSPTVCEPARWVWRAAVCAEGLHECGGVAGRDEACVAAAVEVSSVVEKLRSRRIDAVCRYDLSIWDVVQQGWAKPNGTIGVTVGASSRDGRLSAEVPL